MAMKLAVVIPCRNSAATLGKTLTAIVTGDRKPDELWIIDGLSEDNTRQIATSAGARVLSNPKRHAAAARQIGAQSTKADIVAYTDSDCIPSPDWLSRIEKQFREHPELGGLGGPVHLTRPVSRVQAYSAATFEAIMNFPATEQLLPGKQMRGTLPGANGAYRSEILHTVGGFREQFTNHAEEIDLQWRLVEAGYKILFDPTIIVEHLGYPSTKRQLIRTNYSYGFASTKLAKHHLGWRVDGTLARALLRSTADILLPWRNSRDADLRMLQLGAFQIGKIVSSIRYGTLNL